MKLSDLRIFLDIINAGSLTKAAQQRGTSQPNLSRFLREIEQQLDTTLVHRDGRGVRLTTSGEKFKLFAEETLARYQSMLEDLSGMREGLPKTVDIAVPMRTEHVFLPALLRTFAETEASITLSSRESFSEAAMRDLADRRIDAMIGCLAPTAPCTGEEIAREAFYAIGLPRFLGTSTEPINMRKVLSLPLIVAGPDRYLDHLRRAAEATGNEFLPARFCSAADAMVAFAAEGEGVSILPFSNFQREAESKQVCFRRIIDPIIERPIFLNFRPGLSPQTASMLRRLMLSAINSVQEKSRWS